jgi:phospholipid/cholesterol/gamma-HCH transport system substrate-binding protein
MNDNSPPPAVPPPATAPSEKNLELKATLLLLLMVVLVVASAVYLMYARGAFEATQELVLVSDDSEGVVVGMDLTFSGFPIGRVRRVELAPDGNARILIDVPRKDAHWLRESSVFTLVRGLVGNTNLRAFSGILTDPPLPDGAVRTVLKGDATAEIPRLVAAARDLVQNLTTLTAADGSLASSLGNVQSLTGQINDRLKGPGGAIGALTGNEADARKVSQLLDRTNTLLARLDGLTAKADTQVFGQEGLVRDLKTTVQQINALLGDARGTLQKVDGVLQEAQAVGANVRTATTDLGTLRAEVEASLRKVDHLLNEVNRKWPFARDTEIKLP